VSLEQPSALKITTGCAGATGDCSVEWNDAMARTWTTEGRARADITYDRHLPAGSFLKLNICPSGDCSQVSACGENTLKRFEVDGAQYKEMLQSLTALSPPGVLGCLSVQCTAEGVESECCLNSALINLDAMRNGTQIVFGPLGNVLPIVATPPPLIPPTLFFFGAEFGAEETGYMTPRGSNASLDQLSFYGLPRDATIDSIAFSYAGGAPGDSFTCKLNVNGVTLPGPGVTVAFDPSQFYLAAIGAPFEQGDRIALQVTEAVVASGDLNVSAILSATLE
jgi:hypothetical protein